MAIKKTIILISTIILLIVAILAIIFACQISRKPYFEGEKEFVIEKGETVKQISQHLYEQNLINSTWAFETYLYVRKLQTSVQAGVYVLTPMDIVSLSDTLTAGKVDNELSLKFIEGWTLKNMDDYLVEQKNIPSANTFLDIAKLKNFKNDYNFLQNINSDSLEGFVFPDTYRVYKDSTVQDILIKALDNFDQKLTPAMRTEITAQNKSIYDVLIMASIIEMEMPHEEDRKIVSGLLWKRLADDMLLQVDSSLKYEIGKKNRNALTFEELEIDSPYNTYKYKGLPPTPICNPGESAMRAAIYPKDSDYWFYLSDSDGNTHFAETGEEHENNVNKYLR